MSALEGLRLLDTIYVHLYLAASHAALDHAGRAREAVAKILKADPRATLHKYTSADMAPYKVSKDLGHFRE